MIDSLLLLLFGVLAGFSGSLVGLGGGFIVVPALAFLFQMKPEVIVGTSMAVLLFNSISSTLAYTRQKRIDFAAGASFAAASVPGSIIGAMLTEGMGKSFFIGFGCFLIFISFFLVFKPKKPIDLPLKHTAHRAFIDASGTEFSYSYNRPLGLIVAFFVGYLGSLLGIGGGSILVPTMVVLLNFPPHIAAATSMFTIFLSAIIGTGTHFFLDNIDWWKVLFLAPGAFLGGQLGARVAAKLPAPVILKILSALLVVVGIRLITK
ncbi:MAG TPA: sulfite exporter TauE/SafE family protein [Bacilli bacterium]|nr:sulfite exporter TauE/SafE family protein [Bacilli bacterium]